MWIFMKLLLKVLLFQIKAVPLHRNSEIQQLLNALFDVFFAFDLVNIAEWSSW